ncbi:MAG: hypothetical protein AMJ79_02155 [Phycisphaerae bacterium SM23_30]|nr:MAG: hypothetical protein AMJ79_02155 [Phycisphaerae bacterium SM23_30]
MTEVNETTVTPRPIDKFLAALSETDGASDLLITVGKPPQLRVHNEIVPLDYPVLTPEDTRELCLSLLNQERTKRFELEKEMDTSASLRGYGRYRVNIYQQRGSLAMVVRIIAERVKSFEELGLPASVVKMADLHNGLVLFTGPTGTGKSTTVAAIVNHINCTRRCHIVCIEDPIEYIHAHDLSTVDQREVESDTCSFDEALRRVLRQSPDVIMIGEIRDRASAQAAITLAETGHLTLATLHTRGAVASVDRLIDMFPSEQHIQIRAQLSASLAGVVWQQLLPKADRQGLVLACEVMTMTPAIRALIRKGNTHEIHGVMQAGKKFGMFTMEQAVTDLIRRNLVDQEWINNNGYQ